MTALARCRPNARLIVTEIRPATAHFYAHSSTLLPTNRTASATRTGLLARLGRRTIGGSRTLPVPCRAVSGMGFHEIERPPCRAIPRFNALAVAQGHLYSAAPVRDGGGLFDKLP